MPAGFYHTNLSSPSKTPKPNKMDATTQTVDTAVPKCTCNHTCSACHDHTQQTNGDNLNLSVTNPDENVPVAIPGYGSAWMQRGRPHHTTEGQSTTSRATQTSSQPEECNISANKSKHLEFEVSPTRGNNYNTRPSTYVMNMEDIQRRPRPRSSPYGRPPSPYPFSSQIWREATIEAAREATSTIQHNYINAWSQVNHIEQGTKISAPEYNGGASLHRCRAHSESDPNTPSMMTTSSLLSLSLSLPSSLRQSTFIITDNTESSSNGVNGALVTDQLHRVSTAVRAVSSWCATQKTTLQYRWALTKIHTRNLGRRLTGAETSD